MAKTNRLVPPDVKQCQAEVRSFMTLGPGYNRCQNKPTCIATENEPGPDGHLGSMSLCEECAAELRKRMPPGYARLEAIGSTP